MVDLNSLQVVHHTIQSVLWKQTVLSLVTHKCSELQINEDDTPFVGLTTVDDTVVFFLASFLQIEFLSVFVTSPGLNILDQICFVLSRKKCDVLYDSFYFHWYIFFHISRYSLCLKLAGLCYHVKLLKCHLFCELCFLIGCPW